MQYFGSELGTLLGFLGMGAVELLAVRWIWAAPQSRQGALRNLACACVIPGLCAGSMIAVGLAAYLTPLTFDPVIYPFDAKFGGPSWTIGEIFRSRPWLLETCGSAYNTLPFAFSICLALQWQHGVKFPVNFGLAILAMGAVGFLLYQLCPVAGPAYLFPSDFPRHTPPLLHVACILLPPVPRNDMPSLHVAWALLLAWNLRRRLILMSASVGYLACTVLATLGSCEHYLADLIVSPALVLAVQAACKGVLPKYRGLALVAGSTLTLFWLVAFRTSSALAIPSGCAAWLAIILSVLLPGGIAWVASPGATIGPYPVAERPDPVMAVSSEL